VLLRAASLGRPPYVARLQAVRAGPGGPPEAVMRWFYRLPDVQARLPCACARPDLTVRGSQCIIGMQSVHHGPFGHMKTVLAQTSARSGACEVRATRRRKACTAVRAGMRSQALVGPQGGAPGAAGSSADACEVFYTSETGLHALDSGARLLVVFEPVLHSSHDVLPAGSASALL
jgi:hypothetical protein